MANKKIEEIEGIGPSYGDKLREAEIKDTDSLLEAGCTKRGREKIATTTGINEKQILKWVNMADLFRIKGVGQEYSELLECSGVDTVKELRNRNVENLTKKMGEVNAEKNLTRRVPTETEVSNWVSHAKELPPRVEY